MGILNTCSLVVFAFNSIYFIWHFKREIVDASVFDCFFFFCSSSAIHLSKYQMQLCLKSHFLCVLLLLLPHTVRNRSGSFVPNMIPNMCTYVWVWVSMLLVLAKCKIQCFCLYVWSVKLPVASNKIDIFDCCKQTIIANNFIHSSSKRNRNLFSCSQNFTRTN